jgi:tetratricopeptide (TPR) repeat protein
MRTHSSILSAVTLYQQALQEDPNCADAYAGLAICRFVCAEYMYEPQNEALTLAERDAFRALELQPHHAAAYAVLAGCAASLRYSWREAEQLCINAIRIQPDFVWAHIFLVEHYICEGKLSHAWQALAHAQSLGAADEPYPRIPLVRGSLQYFSGAYEAAIAELTALVADHPAYALARFALAKALTANKDYELAQAQVDQILSSGYDPLRPGQPNVRERAMSLAVLIRAGQGDRAGAETARRAFEDYVRDRATSRVCMAIAAMGCADLDAAMKHLELAIEKRDALSAYAAADPLLAPLRSHSRWPAVQAQMRLIS